MFRWNNGELEKVGDHARVAEDLMLFSFETPGGTYVGFENDVLYRFQSNGFEAVKGQLAGFLSNNILSDGILLNDSLMAFSTLAGGAVVVHVSTNDLHYRFDYTTGVRDNEIFCLGKDRDHGLWLAYEAGLSRVDLAQPVKNFSGYPGIEGNLTASIMVNGALHVGTGSGVFVLKEATSKAEVERMMEDLMRKRKEDQDEQVAERMTEVAQKEQQEEREAISLIERYKENPDDVKEELSKKEIRDLKKEIKRQQREQKKGGATVKETIEEPVVEQKEPEPAETPTPEPVSKAPPSSPSPQTASSTQKKPQAVKKKPTSGNAFLFKRINGIDVKCRQLLNLGDQIFATTNNGLYAIAGETARNLTPGIYINHVSPTLDGKRMLLATLNGVHLLEKDPAGKWNRSVLNDSVRFVAYNAIEDPEGTIWAGADNGAYRYTSTGVTFYPLPEMTNERVLVAKVDGQVLFLLSSGLFQYAAGTDRLLPTTLAQIPASDRLEYLLGNDDIVWVRSSQGWHVLNGDAFIPMLPYLDLFEDVRHLSSDQRGNIYVVDKGLHAYTVLNRKDGPANGFNIYFKQVVDANGQPFSLNATKIRTEGNSLIFNVSAPFYLKSKGTQYQYRIEGFRDNWSRWTNESEIDPGNIPPGDYVLEVRARNILGEVSEIRSLAFSVPQPLLLRWYFLVGYVLLLTLFILGIIKYRERSLKETQRILEDRVTERTSELEKEKRKTEELLLNILPKDTADELQRFGKATARHYNQVSVLFTDFKGFTQFAENTKPEELVNELHRCFVRFDEIIGKYYLEKIKTIGDAYMCAGGVPIRNNSNAIAITLAALEIRDFMTQVAEEKRKVKEPVLEIRIGIHTGPLTAGVVGMKKFAYDIWGDTVNTASRMETASEPGRINVSGTTHELIRKYFVCEFRGKQQVKGKGMVEMYFVNAISPEFSENADGKTPNQALWELIS